MSQQEKHRPDRRQQRGQRQRLDRQEETVRLDLANLFRAGSDSSTNPPAKRHDNPDQHSQQDVDCGVRQHVVPDRASDPLPVRRREEPQYRSGSPCEVGQARQTFALDPQDIGVDERGEVLDRFDEQPLAAVQPSQPGGIVPIVVGNGPQQLSLVFVVVGRLLLHRFPPGLADVGIELGGHLLLLIGQIAQLGPLLVIRHRLKLCRDDLGRALSHPPLTLADVRELVALAEHQDSHRVGDSAGGFDLAADLVEVFPHGCQGGVHGLGVSGDALNLRHELRLVLGQLGVLLDDRLNLGPSRFGLFLGAAGLGLGRLGGLLPQAADLVLPEVKPLLDCRQLPRGQVSLRRQQVVRRVVVQQLLGAGVEPTLESVLLGRQEDPVGPVRFRLLLLRCDSRECLLNLIQALSGVLRFLGNPGLSVGASAGLVFEVCRGLFGFLQGCGRLRQSLLGLRQGQIGRCLGRCGRRLRQRLLDSLQRRRRVLDRRVVLFALLRQFATQPQLGQGLVVDLGQPGLDVVRQFLRIGDLFLARRNILYGYLGRGCIDLVRHE